MTTPRDSEFVRLFQTVAHEFYLKTGLKVKDSQIGTKLLLELLSVEGMVWLGRNLEAANQDMITSFRHLSQADRQRKIWKLWDKL